MSNYTFLVTDIVYSDDNLGGTITGNVLDNVIDGNDGKEIINAGDGNDTVNGGNQNDTLNGELGDDILKGDAGKDIINGGDGNDTIAGGKADDTLFGDAGDDIFNVGLAEGFDHIAGGTGIDSILATADKVKIGLRSLTGIELIDANGFLNVSILGSAAADIIDLAPVTVIGISTVDGGKGNDIILGANNVGMKIVGNGGDDTLTGGGMNDVFSVSINHGFDSFDGGAGLDRIEAGKNNTVIGIESLANVEQVSSGGFANVTIAGSANANVLDFSAVALAGIVSISGGMGDDTIIGDAAANVILGDDGDDLIIGRIGIDVLTGGAGVDVFDFNAAVESFAGGGDQITDFVSGTDIVDLSDIDADTSTAVDDAFGPLVGAFSGTAGEWRIDLFGGALHILGDVDGDAVPDLEVILVGVAAIAAGDVIL